MDCCIPLFLTWQGTRQSEGIKDIYKKNPFPIDSEQFMQKLNEITVKLEPLQLITIVEILSIRIQGNADAIPRRILEALSYVPAFKETFIENSASDAEIDESNTP